MSFSRMFFPQKTDKILDFHWYRHFYFFRQYAEYVGIEVQEVARQDYPHVWASDWPQPNAFAVDLDGYQVIIDYSDLMEEGVQEFLSTKIYFKYYYYPKECQAYANVYPLGSQLDIQEGTLDEFFTLARYPIYTATTDVVLCNQSPHTRAEERRNHVQGLLKFWYGNNADTTFIPGAQKLFWEKLRHCFVSVVVPGCRNDVLDRGHLEQLALGVCTISPPIVTQLPNYQVLMPWVHYIPCAEDYSDLRQVIHWAYTHRDECLQIGANAHEHIWRCYHPHLYWHWIESAVRLHYKGQEHV